MKESKIGEIKFTSRQTDILTLSSQGLSKPQIADELQISSRTVNYHFEKIRSKTKTVGLKAKSYPRLIKAGLSANIISKEKILESCRPEGFDSLTKKENEVVVYLRRGLTNAEIARRLRVEDSTVHTHLNHIYEKVGTSGRNHTISASLSLPRRKKVVEVQVEPVPNTVPSPREKEIINLYAQGLTRVVIAKKLWLDESTVKSHLDSLRKKSVHLDPSKQTTADVLRWGVHDGFIDIDPILKSVNHAALDDLTENESIVFTHIKEGWTNDQIVENTDLRLSDVKKSLSSLYRKINASGKHHAIAAALALEQKEKKKNDSSA